MSFFWKRTLLDERLMFQPRVVQLCRLKAFAACWVGGTILAEGLCDWKGSVGHAPSFNAPGILPYNKEKS